jgi:hypothetical protein
MWWPLAPHHLTSPIRVVFDESPSIACLERREQLVVARLERARAGIRRSRGTHGERTVLVRDFPVPLDLSGDKCQRREVEDRECELSRLFHRPVHQALLQERVRFGGELSEISQFGLAGPTNRTKYLCLEAKANQVDLRHLARLEFEDEVSAMCLVGQKVFADEYFHCFSRRSPADVQSLRPPLLAQVIASG